ncbi:hypothetical protein [Halopseudomonas pelagia]|uniref:hypothetical protein n=1 Tax=Halopseudomonas pelagia TaxID=553151 RepID=UPI0030D8E9C9
MGTETEELQSHIKDLIGRLGWSSKRFAREIHHIEGSGADTDSEIANFEERIKKQLSRKTTKPSLLRRYLEILGTHEDFAELGMVMPHCYKPSSMSQELFDGMALISKRLDESDHDV